MTLQGDGTEQNNGHGETGSFESEYVMGVRVVIDPDPATAAARLAEELDGELIFDADAARRAFAARSAAGRTDPVVLEDDELESLVARADELDSERAPDVEESALFEIRELADALARTDRIRMRTEVEFTETLNRRLSASSGMAVHPETIKQAGRNVTESEAEIKQIDAAIEALGERPTPEVVEMASPEPAAALFDDSNLESRRRARAFALAIGTIFGGVGVILLSAGVAVVVPIVVFSIGLLVTIVLIARSFMGSVEDDPDAREASALLAAATGNAQRSSEAGAAHRLAEEEWLSRRSQLEAARERAEEKVRSARRHWDGLAGPEADPYDLDAVLRVHDPQFVITDAATKTSPTVRTVNAVHRRAMARWKVAWAALGYDTPPDVADLDEELARLSGASARVEAEEVGQRLEAAQAWSDAGATIDRPMILVEPENWLPEQELESMLGLLPAGAEVILVTR